MTPVALSLGALLRRQHARRRRYCFGFQPIDALAIGAVQFRIVARAGFTARFFEQRMGVLAVDRAHERRAEIVPDQALQLFRQGLGLFRRQGQELIFLLAQPAQRKVERDRRARCVRRVGLSAHLEHLSKRGNRQVVTKQNSKCLDMLVLRLRFAVSVFSCNVPSEGCILFIILNPEPTAHD